MKIGLCTIAFREKLLEDALNVAQALGFDGVEIWGREPHISETYDDRRVKAARKMAESRGLAVACFGSYLRLPASPRDEEEQVTPEDALQTTQALGASICRVWAGDVASRQAGKEQWRATVEGLEHACEMAAHMDITLAVEMHDGTLADTARSALSLLSDVGAANLGLNFQVSADRDGEDARARLELVLPHVVHVHAQNHRPSRRNLDGRMELAPLSEGLVDYREIVSMLADAGHQGFVDIEFVPQAGGGKVKALAEDYWFLRRLCDSS